MKRIVLAGTIFAVLTGCTSPIYPITANPPTPDPKVAQRYCVDSMMRATPTLGLIPALAATPERQQIYDACMAAHGWRGGD